MYYLMVLTRGFNMNFFEDAKSNGNVLWVTDKCEAYARVTSIEQDVLDQLINVLSQDRENLKIAIDALEHYADLDNWNYTQSDAEVLPDIAQLVLEKIRG